jgi:transcriptional regulator with XRE-family HTH domain
MRWARDDAHLSQAQIAERMGVSPQAVSRVERNAGSASLATLAKYAAALGGRLELHIAPATRVREQPTKPSRARVVRKR